MELKKGDTAVKHVLSSFDGRAGGFHVEQHMIRLEVWRYRSMVSQLRRAANDALLVKENTE